MTITVYVTVTAATSSTAAQIAAAASGTTLAGGGDAAAIAPGSIVSVTGTQPLVPYRVGRSNQNPLPNKLGGTQVYFNGIPAPLMMVSPDNGERADSLGTRATPPASTRMSVRRAMTVRWS